MSKLTFLVNYSFKTTFYWKTVCKDWILTLTIWRDINFLWKFADVHLKPVLNIVQSAGVSLIWHKGDGQTFRSKPAGPCNLKEWEKLKAVQMDPFTLHNLTLLLSHKLNKPCAGMCLNLQACRSWRRCWLFRCPYLGQTDLWPPGSVSGNPWIADIELIWDNNKSLKCDMST